MTTMRVLAIVWFLLMILIGLITALSGQERGYTLAIGRLGATDDDLGQCLFSIGQHAHLALHPKGEPCVIARELIGRTGKLVYVAD